MKNKSHSVTNGGYIDNHESNGIDNHESWLHFAYLCFKHHTTWLNNFCKMKLVSFLNMKQTSIDRVLCSESFQVYCRIYFVKAVRKTIKTQLPAIYDIDITCKCAVVLFVFE